MSNSDKKTLLQTIFKDVFEKDGFDIDIIKKYFDESYRQDVDGKILYFDEFVSHMKALKASIQNAAFTFEELIQEGDTVVSVHYPEATKIGGGKIKAKVIAVFKFKEEKLISCNELTHLVEGDEADRDMGSRH